MVARIGEMRERVTIERATTVADGGGGQTVTWAAVYSSIPAKVQPVRGREGQVQGREMTVETYLVEVRHGYTITPLDRVVWGSKTLNIRTVQNRDMVYRRLVMECELGFGT